MLAFFRLQIWIVVISDTQSYLFFYNKNNKIVIKLNNNTFIEEIKKQVLEKVIHRIDIYFIENNISNTQLCRTCIFLSKNIAIQMTNIEKAEKLRDKNGQIKVLRSKIKLSEK